MPGSNSKSFVFCKRYDITAADRTLETMWNKRSNSGFRFRSLKLGVAFLPLPGSAAVGRLEVSLSVRLYLMCSRHWTGVRLTEVYGVAILT